MKRYLFSLIAIFLLLGCDDEAEEQMIETDEFSVVVGDYIYRLIQGDQQVGAKGQVLPEEIIIKVTDLRGDMVSRNLNYEFSNLDSRIEGRSFDTETGQEAIRWRLGCDGSRQSLMITDRFCNGNFTDCEYKVIFEIEASARDFQDGWNRSCQQFDYVDYQSRIYISNDQVFLASENVLYKTTSISSDSWEFHEPIESLPGNTQIFSKADNAVVREKYGRFFVTGNNGNSWYDTNFTIYNADEIDSRVVSTLSGDDYLIEENRDVILKKPDVFSYYWDEALSIRDITQNESSKPQAIAVDGDQTYIATNTNSIIKIEDGVSTLLSFPDDSWISHSGDFDYVQFHVSNQIGFHIFNDRQLTVLDLNTMTVVDEIESEYLRIAGNMDDTYILDGRSGDYWTFEEGSLSHKKFYFPEEANDYIIDINFFRSEPVFLTFDGYLYYHK